MEQTDKYERKEKNKGSVAVETMLFFIPFFFAFCIIISMARFVQAEMIIHHAITQTAKEISAYGYVATRASVTKRIQNNNKVKGEFEGDVQKVADNFGSFVTAFSGGDVNGAIASGKEIYNTSESYISDPSRIAGGVIAWIRGGLTKAAGVALVETLGKSSISKHIGKNTQSADAYLKMLGVVNGMSGLDFSKSGLVTNSKGKGNVDIVVTFRMKNTMFPQFSFAEKKFVLCASTLMW